MKGRVQGSAQARGAFTLIELMAALLVIGILIAIAFGAFERARTIAWREKTRDTGRQLAAAWNMRLQTDREFPDPASFEGRSGPDSGPNAEITFPATSQNMAVLNNNVEGRTYFEQNAEQRANGMQDRWKNLFYVRLDLNYDGKVKNPTNDTAVIFANVVVWSWGEDKRGWKANAGLNSKWIVSW